MLPGDTYAPDPEDCKADSTRKVARGIFPLSFTPVHAGNFVEIDRLCREISRKEQETFYFCSYIIILGEKRQKRKSFSCCLNFYTDLSN